MNGFQKLILYPLCFLYAITPGSKHLEDNGSHYFEALFLGVMNALIIPAIFYYFFDYSSRSYLHAVGSIGSWVGAWTLLGGMYYPILSDILDKDEVINRDKASQRKLKNEQDWRSLKNEYYELLEEDRDAAYDLILDAFTLHTQGRAYEIKNVLFKNAGFIYEETNRFNIDDLTLQTNRIKRVTAERKAQAERERQGL